MNDHAQATLVAATRRAFEGSHREVTPEHLLAVLVTPNKGRGNAVVRLLDTLQVSPTAVHERVVRSLPSGDSDTYPRISACTERILQRAEEEATRQQCEFVAPEHLFFGIVREGTSSAAQLLIGVGATLETIPKKMEQLTA